MSRNLQDLDEDLKLLFEEKRDYYSVLEDLLYAFYKASRHKKSSNNYLSFDLVFEESLTSLAKAIVDREYEISPSNCFIVDQPVKREVIAAKFHDRIIHHYVCSYLSPFLEKELIHDCYSCRDNKGTSFGVDRLEHHIRACSLNYTRRCYALQLDIRGYFMHINREILLEKANKLLDKIARQRDEDGCFYGDKAKHAHISYLVEKFIMHDPMRNCIFRCALSQWDDLPKDKSMRFTPEGIGLPIGNLTSQLFSNLYLNDFDHYVKRDLKCKHYGRYVDDFYIIHEDKDFLLSIVPRIDDYLRTIGLELHPDKLKLQEVRKGVTFLGVHIKPYRRYLKKKSLNRIKDKMYRLREDIRYSLELLEQHRALRKRLLSVCNSYYGYMGQVSAYKLAVKMGRSCPLMKIGYMLSHYSKTKVKKRRNGDRKLLIFKIKKIFR